MIRLYLEKTFFNLLLERKKRDRILDDFVNGFLSKIKNVTVITDWQNIDDIKVAAEECPLADMLLESLPQFEFVENVCSSIRDILNNNNLPPFIIFLGNDAEVETIALREKFGVECIAPGNIELRWPVYNAYRDDIFRNICDDDEWTHNQVFDSWQCFDDFKHPFNSCIIVDPYILKWRSIRQFKNAIQLNIQPMLRHLIHTKPSSIPLDLTFVSELHNEDGAINSRIEKSYKLIEKCLQDIEVRNYRLNIIVYDHVFTSEILRGHDRYIITNYFLIHTDAGFSIFKENGRIRTGSIIYFRTIFNSQNIHNIMFRIKWLKAYISQVEENRDKIRNRIYFYPNSENRIISAN